MENSVLARLRDILKGWGPADPRNVLRETDSFTKLRMGLDCDCEGSDLHPTFCLIEVRAMVVAVQHPLVECTAIFTVSIV